MYIPVHNTSYAVWKKYQDVQLHLVAFCSMQVNKVFGYFDPQTSEKKKIDLISWPT